MGVYIKCMEMPTSCRACLYSRTDIRNVDWCVLTEKDLPCDCPLVPVPPHYDLIDRKTVSENLASVLNKKNPPFSYPDWNDAIVAMLTAPTIIPAEEG